ncbi:MAG: BppU family phage baseplate upper protein [Motilibacteraceae bacterium]
MATFTTGDTAPALTGTVNADLTGASAAVHVRKPDATVIDAPATITDPATGAWSYAWQVGDLDVTGAWAVELQVTYSGGEVQTFGPQTFYVQPQIA